MVILKVSYERPEELAKLVNLLGSRVKSMKTREQRGKYKRAYIDLIEPTKALEDREDRML